MSDKLDEAEFWLPSEFLTDEDILMDNKENRVKSVGLCFPSEFPYDYGSSVLSSPVESVVGSTETESDEDDLLLTELTRQLALHEAHKITPAQKNHEKAWALSGSPQSTLTQVGSWSGRSTMSSNGSPNGPSQVSSPPTTPLGVNDDAWDLIYQAAGQVERLKMNGSGDGPTRNPGLLGPPRRLPTPPPPTNFSPSTVYHNQVKQDAGGIWSRHAKNGWSYDSREVLQNLGGRIGGGMGYGNAMGAGVGQAPCGWPSQHQRNRQYVGELGMKVGGGIYSGCGYGYGFSYGSGGGVSCGGGGGLKKERSGTGVFLPRRYDSNCASSFKASDARKKPGSCCAWVPNKVAPISNKNLDDINEIVQPKSSSRNSAGFMGDFDALMARRNALLAQQRQRSLCPEGSISHHEICLPQEWTY
ncbi:unnamed protein product [Coffea canephora]|uniref:Uncharacterized protein n=1 Tax=Coffea canephora TaxID=49390 RepID=A0A068VG09_COFCA|nr:unnamed protein product [Coffea canephora]